MNKFIKSSIIFLVISVFITTGVNALTCYECSNIEPGFRPKFIPGCEDPFQAKPEFLIECGLVTRSNLDESKQANICLKTHGEINGIATVTRKCGYVENPSQKAKCIEKEKQAEKGAGCGCIEDGCNGGAKIGTNLILSIFTVMFVAFLPY